MVCFRWGTSSLPSRPNCRQGGARVALLTISFVNLLNFADRFLPNSLKEDIKNDLDLTDAETSYPTTGMIAVYMCAAIVFGSLVDRDLVDRRALLAAAVAFWSLATALGGLSTDLLHLILFRSLVGVGEAAFSTVVPPFIADFFPKRDRMIAYTVYQLAAQIGAALGYVIGGGVGGLFGWRMAFLVCGLPGIFAACLIPRLNDPARGINDVDVPSGAQSGAARSDGWWSDVQAIFQKAHWMAATIGVIMVLFMIGAYAEWYATLLQREGNMGMSEVGIFMGLSTIVGGLIGTIMGQQVTQHFEQYWKNACFVVPALFLCPGAALGCIAVNFAHYPRIACASFLCAQVCLFTFSAPLSTVSMNAMPVQLRSRASALQLFLVHILGDMISPPIVGVISDRTGDLKDGLQIAWIMGLIAAFVWLAAAYILPPLDVPTDDRQDEALMKAAPGSPQQPLTMSSLLCGGDEDDDVASAVHTAAPIEYGSVTKGA